ncbi:extracellular solute-binding protein [Candidatus Babeliales bacterium]|nr:extracellular solute-binding protein [Candidatus Babeliales bacterium]
MFPYVLKKSGVEEKSLRIYSWANRIDESVLQNFQNKTGIKVYLNYYESVEELLTKLEVMPHIDCDLMLPSSYAIPRMIDAHVIKQIDISRCNFIEKIYPVFLKISNTGEQLYALPLYWDVFGIGYNAKTVQNQAITLDLLFDKNKIIGSQVGMTDEPREAIFLAAQYLNFDLNHLTSDILKKIRRLLRDQKAWVGAYSDSQQGYFLASDTFDVVASDREIICRQMLTNAFVKFALLPKGSMLRVDSMVINALSNKDDLIYEFLNYLFSEEVVLHHAQQFCLLPTMPDVFNLVEKKYIGIDDFYIGSTKFQSLLLFNLNLSQKEINDFWMRFKAS